MWPMRAMECEWGLSHLGSVGIEKPGFRIMLLRYVRCRMLILLESGKNYTHTHTHTHIYIYIDPVLASSSLGSRK